MEMKNIRYKALALGMGALTLFSTSCSDFLDGKIVDKNSSSSLQTYDNHMDLTKALYGGYIWSDYEAKFGWVINDGAAGNLYNTYQNEGMPYLLQISDQNDIINAGYRSLYSGVISTANQIIHKDMPNLSVEEANEIVAEARLFRGLAHFMATEYWGEVPLVWNTGADISSEVKLPRVTRATLYAAIEKDFQFAMNHLPAVRPSAYRMHATKWAAEAMLARLYLTMASCQTKGLKCPFSPSELNYTSEFLYTKVDTLTTEIITKGGFSLQNYEEMFAYKNDYSDETIFAWHWNEGKYAEGSQYQCQMSRDAFWGPGAGWGGGKGLSYTLYKSFDDGDARKKDVCIYVGPTYTSQSGSVAYKAGAAEDGKTFLGKIGVLNNIKKFVYGATFSTDYMSGWGRYDIVRLSQVYMMRQEAKMLRGGDIEAKCSDLADLNAVLLAHGAPQKAASMAFYTPVIGKVLNAQVTIGGNTYNSRNGNADFSPYSDANDKEKDPVLMYSNTPREDFIQELRKEFVMEGQSWFDLKRMYYMNPKVAKQFLYEQDRACAMTQDQELDGSDAKLQTEVGFNLRLALNNDILNQRIANGEDISVGSNEVKVYVEEFDKAGNWFIPFPATSEVTAKLDMSSVKNFVQEVLSDSYPY